MKEEMMLEEDDLRIKKRILSASIFFALLMLTEIPFSLLLLSIHKICPEQYINLVNLIFSQGYFLIFGLLYMFFCKIRCKRDLNMKKYSVSSFFLSILLLIVATPMANWLNIVSQLFVTNDVSKLIMDVTENVPYFVAIFVIGIMPGFTEELLYRGIIYSAFRKYSVLSAVLVSAICFGFMHKNFNQIGYAIYLGIIFAMLVEVTDSLISSMVLHIIFNAFSTTQLYLIPIILDSLREFTGNHQQMNIDQMMNTVPDKKVLLNMSILSLPMAVVSVILTVLVLKLIAKKNGKNLTMDYLCKKKTEQVNKRTVYNGFIIVGLIYCLVNAIILAFYK